MKNYEIRVQCLNNENKIQTIGAVEKQTVLDLNALKEYIDNNDAYKDFKDDHWKEYPMSVGIIFKNNSNNYLIIRVTEVED